MDVKGVEPLNRRAFVVHQHVHVDTPTGIATDRYAVGMIRLMTDNFAEVVHLTPTRDPEDGELDTLVTYPDNVTTRSLYHRAMSEPKLKVARLHLWSAPTILREVAKADVVQVRLPQYPSVIASIFAMMLRKDMVVSIHGNWSRVMRQQNGPDSRFWKLIGRGLDAYHRWVTGRSRVTFVAGSHNQHLSSKPAVLFANHQFEESNLFERADTCQSESIDLLYVGALAFTKGTGDLLKAVAILRQRGLNYRLRLVGRATFDVSKHTRELGIEDYVEPLGFVPWGERLFAEHRRADIFAFPSWGEGAPKAPMEAMSQCLPVVATADSGIVDGETGVLVPAEDPEALADGLHRMATDGSLRRRCIAGGFQVARDHTRSRMLEHINRALRECLG